MEVRRIKLESGAIFKIRKRVWLLPRYREPLTIMGKPVSMSYF